MKNLLEKRILCYRKNIIKRFPNGKCNWSVCEEIGEPQTGMVRLYFKILAVKLAHYNKSYQNNLKDDPT